MISHLYEQFSSNLNNMYLRYQFEYLNFLRTNNYRSVLVFDYIHVLLQALDAAMKQYKASSPDTAAMFFTVDCDISKIICMSCVPKVGISCLFVDCQVFLLLEHVS